MRPGVAIGQAPKKNPAGKGGAHAQSRANHQEALIMNATPLFGKEKAFAKAISEEEQLLEWIARGASELFTVTTLVTPKMADLLLKRNAGNRPLIWGSANRSVAAYAAAMSRGEWRLNGEAIIVSSSGELNDGQHRLSAVIESGEAVHMQISFGVDRETRHTVDQGVARTPGHILAMAGEKSTNQLATALQFMWAIDGGLSFNHRPSMDQLLATLDAHPTLRNAVKQTGHLSGEYRLSAGYIAGAHYLCQRQQPFQAGQWLSALTTGLNIQNVNSPVSRLRKMYGEHSAKRQRKEKIDQAALYIKGFNMFLRGRTGAFTWRANGPSPEAFPVVGG